LRNSCGGQHRNAFVCNEIARFAGRRLHRE
jgi:hypothetical protein